MRLFSCKVRLSNSLHNEVQKISVTAAEIMILRHIHGLMDTETGEIDSSCVIDIKPTGTVSRTDTEERRRLQSIYGTALKRHKKSIDTLFGVGQPLPQAIEDEEGVAALDASEEKPKRKNTRRKDRAETDPGFEAPPSEDLDELAG